VKEYYDTRAPEYDEWWLGQGRFAKRERPGWEAELAGVTGLLAALPPVRTLDVACGTGFVTQHLPGEIVGLDQSAAMIEIAGRRLPGATFVVGDALALPFPDGAFARLFASYFYCHLEEAERATFLAEARRVAPELLVLGSRRGEGDELERWEERVLNDGSRWEVFKRVFEPDALAAELGGEVLHAGRWFVLVRAA
jgi:demethylmenaquinone methyltransferase/2-methoxy-6-polyprenyl-1,4-benzoquinol methylase